MWSLRTCVELYVLCMLCRCSMCSSLCIGPSELLRAQVLPKLYLPIMEEGCLRVLQWWRFYIPNAAWRQHRRNLRQLNEYLYAILDQRWQERQSGAGSGPNERGDMLDTLMRALEVGFG